MIIKLKRTSQISGDPFGLLKFVVNRENQEILGVHLFINGADSLSGEASLIVANKLTLEECGKYDSSASFPDRSLRNFGT